MSIHSKLAEVQARLKAPKTQTNEFGKYKYRSCEDILSAVKPLLDGLSLTITDDIVMVGDRIYVKATATISDGKDAAQVSAFAREPVSKKGADESQITGAASSYARKYALNGLLAIDDTADADATHDHKDEPKSLPAYPDANIKQNWEAWEGAISTPEAAEDLIAKISTRFALSAKQQQQIRILGRQAA